MQELAAQAEHRKQHQEKLTQEKAELQRENAEHSHVAAESQQRAAALAAALSEQRRLLQESQQRAADLADEVAAEQREREKLRKKEQETRLCKDLKNLKECGYTEHDFEKDLEKAKAFVKDHAKYEHLNICDVVAVRVYSRVEVFKSFNKACREEMGLEGWTQETWPWIYMYYHTQNGVRELHGAGQNDTLYRGQDNLYGDEEKIRDWDGQKDNGPTFTWASFTSTSTDRQVAGQPQFGYKFIFEIYYVEDVVQ